MGPASSRVDDVTEQAADVAEAATSADPRVGLRAVWALRQLVDQLELLQVRSARDAGWSWREIAEELNVTRQAVHQKYGALLKPSTEDD
jgi:hypothetical protein